MAKSTTLAAQPRERAGKGAARATRRAGRVPAVIYGNKIDPMMISVDPVDLMQQIRRPGFFARVYEISVGKAKERVLARDLQVDPVTDRPIHVDFLRFGAGTQINIDVPLAFVNHEESPGLKRGGVLNVISQSLQVVCDPDVIPDNIVIDLTGLDIGAKMSAAEVVLPEGVVLPPDTDQTLATIVQPTLAAEDEDEDEAVEGEEVEGEEGAPDEAAPEEE
jgi:large subunit ribosomal protein L25